MLPHAPAFWRFCRAKTMALGTGSRRCCVCSATQSIPGPGLLQPTPGRCFCFLPWLWVCVSHTRATSRSSPHSDAELAAAGTVVVCRDTVVTATARCTRTCTASMNLQAEEDKMGSIYQLFEASVARFAERPALIEAVAGGEKSMTYRALQEQACCFAGYLQQQQIGKGDRVCIWAASCSNWMVAYLGALLVGAVVVPLDVNTTEDFLRRIAETTEAKLLVTTQKQYAGLKQPPLPLVAIDALPQGTLDATKLPTIRGDDLAELVFTSGTTGHPKGVMLSHRNIIS